MLKTLPNGIFLFVPYYKFLDQGRKELKIYLLSQLDGILKKHFESILLPRAIVHRCVIPDVVF